MRNSSIECIKKKRQQKQEVQIVNADIRFDRCD